MSERRVANTPYVLCEMKKFFEHYFKAINK